MIHQKHNNRAVFHDFAAKLAFFTCPISHAVSILFLSSPLIAQDAKSTGQGFEVRPRIYLTPADVARLRQQATRPELAAAYADLKAKSIKSVEGWRKKYPVTPTPRTTDELIEIGKRDNPWPDFKIVATAFALNPTPELGQVLREKLISRVGARKINNYWRELGIHEGETAMVFLRSYDLIAGTRILTAEDEKVIKEALRACGHHLEGWTLDNDFSRSYRSSYCLNFHTFSSSILGTIAMLYPDLPESAEWLRWAQSELPKQLFTEFGIDGGYGEGSMHYWHPTYSALLGFMVSSKNFGMRDYFSNPEITDIMRRTLEWRMDLMAPDGRCVAVGDGHRSDLGADYFQQTGQILRDPVYLWAGKTSVERVRGARVPEDPYELFHIDLSLPAQPPKKLFANYPFSGYGSFRSGWGPQDNYLLFKYGTTFIGRREAENNLIIPGHAHADALQIELHYKGIPVLVDPGTIGVYQNWGTYGGYCKATVAHNTVGIGNPWGYDRLDGRYEEHVKKHGKEFLYETSQKNIGRADTELKAFGDAGQICIISARLKTYADVNHQRTVIWFRDTGVTVVGDNLESPDEKTYEWYLNPVGKLLKQDKTLSFGDEVAKLDVVPILPRDTRVQILSKGDPNVPPYYLALRPDSERSVMGFKGSRRPYVMKDRWELTTLLTLQSKAKKTDFLNVLIPYQQQNPLVSASMGGKGVKLTGADSTLLVAAADNDSSTLSVDGGFGLARLDKGKLNSYALKQGHSLKLDNQELIGVKLLSEAWAPFYNSAVTAAVSLTDRRASINLATNPMDRNLIMFSPKIEEGKEPPLPIQISVKFKVDGKPRRIIALYSSTKMPALKDPKFEPKTSAIWQPDYHAKFYTRQELPFTWDEKLKTIGVTLDCGIHQLAWE
jgi:hypothetical protein